MAFTALWVLYFSPMILVGFAVLGPIVALAVWLDDT